MPLETTSERDLLSPNAVLCERVASYFGRIAKIGYFLVAVAVSFWLVLGENREILPPGFWPMLGWTSLALCFPLSLYLWLRPSRGLREQFDSMTIKRSDLRSLGRVNQALVQENSRLNQELSLLRARSDDPAVGDEILRHCFRIQNAKLEAEDTHQLYIPVREEFRVDNSLDSNYISGVCFQDFIQVLPSQRQWCQEKGFNLGRYLKRYPPAEAIDQLRFDILESHWSETSFSHDEKIYGVNDFWEPAIYFWYLKRGDCETHATTVQALFLAAGLIDMLEMLTWNSCGRPFNGSKEGNGHSTVYAYSCISEKWHHLEPIRPQSAFRLIDLPVIHDESDETNLRSFAISFNSQMTRKGSPE